MTSFSTGPSIQTNLFVSIVVLVFYVAGGIAIMTTVTANLGIIILAALLGGIGLFGFLGMLFVA